MKVSLLALREGTNRSVRTLEGLWRTGFGFYVGSPSSYVMLSFDWLMRRSVLLTRGRFSCSLMRNFEILTSTEAKLSAGCLFFLKLTDCSFKYDTIWFTHSFLVVAFPLVFVVTEIAPWISCRGNIVGPALNLKINPHTSSTFYCICDIWQTKK
jgi:hypothetical protein